MLFKKNEKIIEDNKRYIKDREEFKKYLNTQIEDCQGSIKECGNNDYLKGCRDTFYRVYENFIESRG